MTNRATVYIPNLITKTTDQPMSSQYREIKLGSDCGSMNASQYNAMKKEISRLKSAQQQICYAL